MFPNLFILNSAGEVLIEKHWEGKVARKAVEAFLEQRNKAASPEDVLPIIETPKFFLVHSRRQEIVLLSTLNKEDPPLFALDIQNKILQVLAAYFKGSVTPKAVRDNFTLIYHLLDEMVDGGFPFTTESNQLMAMIQPPTMVNKMIATFASSQAVKKALPEGILTQVPWRRTGVKYLADEMYVDLIEEMNCIVDKSHRISSCEVRGSVVCTSKLSGMPDVRLTVNQPSLIQDATLHRCVRINRFRQARIVSFVPPDGRFTLLNYFLRGQTQLPLEILPSIEYRRGGGSVRITVKPIARNMKRPFETVKLVIPFPKEMLSSQLKATQGAVRTVESKGAGQREVTWVISKLRDRDTPRLEGTVQFSPDFMPPSRPTILVDFKIQDWNTSGIRVDDIEIKDAKKKNFRGVKVISLAGKYEVRC